jgi:Fe-S oxidoreductase
MNPGKVVDAYRLDEDLKLGPGFDPPPVKGQFAYPDDGGDFAHAAIRCVGVGRCRIPQGGQVMCPSFMVTRDEKHTTRGRARLLYEMLRGEVVDGGWRSREVKEALDLCLACKGCTSDCPVHVDMPTYKAEFLHRHWHGRLRPRHAYAFGLIDQAARMASNLPELANLALHAPGVARLLKLAAGMSLERDVPRFAELTLRDWFFARPEQRSTGRRVIVWPDTFNNYFHAGVGIAAVEAIEAAGWTVVMPRRHHCCGRPLYDYGFLNVARSYLRAVVGELRDEIRAGTPLVGIEPSCLATFKHELVRMLPHDVDARRLSEQSYHFAAFFTKFGLEPPRLSGEALLWGHCHQKATGGMEPDQQLLERMGLSVRRVDGACCGLAGSWGFESGHHALSVAAGDIALLPSIKDAPAAAVIVADGFSCKTQIEQGGTGRRALHLAEVMKLGRLGYHATAPELAASMRRPGPTGRVRARHAAATAGVLGAVLAVGAVAVSRVAGALRPR